MSSENGKNQESFVPGSQMKKTYERCSGCLAKWNANDRTSKMKTRK